MKSAKLRQRNRRTTAAASVKRVVVEFPAPLFTRAEHAVAELSTNRSDLVRTAVERYLESLERAKLERELAEGYVANEAQTRASAEDLAALESDFA